MPSTAEALGKLRNEPVHFGGCCAGISWPLLETLTTRLPEQPNLILSVGCGGGLLEALLLKATDSNLNIVGVEVPPCVNEHLPEDRLLRVPCTASLHPDALLASTLMFVYPRKPSLIANYLDQFQGGAVEQVIWLGHRSDWPDVETILKSAFYKLEIIEGPGLPEYELLAIVTIPNR
jgi:hypothetical protein